MNTISPEEHLRRSELMRSEAVERFCDRREAEWLQEQEGELESLRAQWEEEWIEARREEIREYLAEREEKWRDALAVEAHDMRRHWEDDWQEEGMPGFGDGWTILGVGSAE